MLFQTYMGNKTNNHAIKRKYLSKSFVMEMTRTKEKD